jgi:hypothetical protein
MNTIVKQRIHTWPYINLVHQYTPLTHISDCKCK